MAAPIFLIFFQSQQPVIIPVEGEPAGDDYNGRKRRKRRGLRPDPFEQWPDEDHNLPMVAREPAGWPPQLFPMDSPMPPLQGVIRPAQADPSAALDRMLGRPQQAPQAPGRHWGAMKPRLPPMAPSQASPEEIIARMLRQ